MTGIGGERIGVLEGVCQGGAIPELGEGPSVQLGVSW